jgi:anti-anti-sigma factor
VIRYSGISTVTPSTQPFKIEILDSASGATILKLIGPLTIQTLFDFQHAVREETTKPIILDLSGVAYMDSAGLGCVVSAFTSCQRTHRAFAITGIGDRIQTLFAVTHVDGLLPCFASLEAAEAAVENSAQ